MINGPAFEQRRRWFNQARNEWIDPLRIYRPESIEEVVAIVQEAERQHTTVRAVGSHHAWSDVALSSGFVLEPEGMAEMLRLEDDLLRDGTDASLLVRCEAGIRLRELNAHLDKQDKALPNMGGYDAQTVAGVLATATHGSGIGFGPIASFAVSLDVVASGGRVLRIEREDGPTDRARYVARYGDARELLQDDRRFDAAIVSMGCMGVVCAVMLAVQKKFWLNEVRKEGRWSAVREELRTLDVLKQHRHYELLINPYPDRDGEHHMVVTTRKKTDEPTGLPIDRRERNPVVELLAALPIVPRLLNALFDIRPKITPVMLDKGLAALVDEGYTDVSYRVFNIGTANQLPVFSSEIAVPCDDRLLHIKAVERIIAIAERHQRLGRVFATAPFSLRFVGRSSSYLAMMHGYDVMTIELIILHGTEGGFELLAAFEEGLYELGGRPHWGQYNRLHGGATLLKRLYPAWQQWLDVHDELNASGVFDSPFSRRVGIAKSTRP